MRLIIAGSRNIDICYEDMYEYMPSDWEGLELVSGMAKGPDWEAVRLAGVHNLPCHMFPADWDKHGRAAGIIRNKQMGDFADELLAFWDGKSRGTKHMIDYMTSLNKPVKVVEIGKTTI